MSRKIIVTQADGNTSVLTETPAEDERELQGLIKKNPGLLPIEEFGLTGPLMVVGEETPLQSGSVDLVGLTRAGDLIILEFKTGPQNPDFRRATSQLLDYGSDLWGMPLEEFESGVAVRYFGSERCLDKRVKGARNLKTAVMSTWQGISDEEWESMVQRLAQHLATGSFEFVLAAQRFTDSAKRTLEYLNTVSERSRFYAVELVRFAGDQVSAFESRTVLKPTKRRDPTVSHLDETEFLECIDDTSYREVLRELLAAVRGLGLRIDWGTVGCSVRVLTSFRPDPLTVAWLFPPLPNRRAWLGLNDWNMGFDHTSLGLVPEAKSVLERYVERVGTLPVERTKPGILSAYHFQPEQVIELRGRIVELLAEVARESGT